MGNLTVFYLLSSQKAKDKCITYSIKACKILHFTFSYLMFKNIK